MTSFEDYLTPDFLLFLLAVLACPLLAVALLVVSIVMFATKKRGLGVFCLLLCPVFLAPLWGLRTNGSVFLRYFAIACVIAVVASLCYLVFHARHKVMVTRRIIFAVAAVVVVIVVVGAFAFSQARKRADLIDCVDRMLSIGVVAELWAYRHDGHFPPDLLSMSNEVTTPKTFVCPGEHSREPASSWAAFTPAHSSFEIVTPNLQDGDTNRVFMRCKIHGSVLYGDGSVFVRGKRYHRY